MKIPALLLIAGALCLYGSAFLGVWTPPGLEFLPTYQDVLKSTPWATASEEEEEEPKSEIRPITAAAEFRPHGVTANWGDGPVIQLPRRPQPALGAQEAQPASPPPARPPVAKPTPQIPPKVVEQKRRKSYTLTASRGGSVSGRGGSATAGAGAGRTRSVSVSR